MPEPSVSSDSWSEWWNRTRYQLYAPIYDAVARPLEPGRERAIERLGLTSDDRILLVGCGTGADLKFLPSEASIAAIDAAPGMVRRTRQRAENLGMTVDARIGDARALPFEDDAFDAVVLHLILAVVPDPHPVATEAARVLAPGGRISVYDKFAPDDAASSLLRRALNPVARFLFSDLTRRLEPLLSGAGLQDVAPRESTLGGLYTMAVARPVQHRDLGSPEGA